MSTFVLVLKYEDIWFGNKQECCYTRITFLAACSHVTWKENDYNEGVGRWVCMNALNEFLYCTHIGNVYFCWVCFFDVRSIFMFKLVHVWPCHSVQFNLTVCFTSVFYVSQFLSSFNNGNHNFMLFPGKFVLFASSWFWLRCRLIFYLSVRTRLCKLYRKLDQRFRHGVQSSRNQQPTNVQIISTLTWSAT